MYAWTWLSVCQDGADKRRAPSSDEELEALLAAHGLLDGGLALITQARIEADVELCTGSTRTI